MTSPTPPGLPDQVIPALLESLDDLGFTALGAIIITAAPDGQGVTIDYGARMTLDRADLALLLRGVIQRLEVERN